jgi:hypothetical protein
MRKAFAFLAMLVAVLSAAPALAAPSQGLDLASWVSRNTDLAVSQIAIAGADNVYSLEPLGPRTSAGEVLAFVRTEAVTPGWRATHRFQSWDAHMLFDCGGGRVRVLRSASYLEPRQQGPARANDLGEAWFSPEADTPAATLLAAACDASFAWPLRAPPAPMPSTSRAEASVVTAAPRPPAFVRTLRATPQLAMVAAEPPAAAPRAIEYAGSQSARRAPAVIDPPLGWPVRLASLAARPQASFSAAGDPVGAPRHGGLWATTAAAMKASLRWAGAGRGWLARRVEFALRRAPTPSLPDPGTIVQARAD